MTGARQELETKLKSFEQAKKSAKGSDDVLFVENARKVVATIREIAKLPEDNELTDFQIGSYCWSLYAIASKSPDAEESRRALVRLIGAYRKKIDNPQFWGSAKSADFGKTLFKSVILLSYQLVKRSNEGTSESFLKAVGASILEILDLRAESFLDHDAFHRDAVTEAQCAAMAKHTGKKIKLKYWPSIAEKAFGLMNRVLKIMPAAKPSLDLVSFLAEHVSLGDWLGYYCAKAQIRIGDYDKARMSLVALLKKKPQEGWLWSDLAEACRDCPDVAVSCLAKALLCPNHDPQIAEGMANKDRKLMAAVLQSLGHEPAPVDLKDVYYQHEAEKAEVFVFGEKASDLSKVIAFSGCLQKRAGNAFGFVKDAKFGSIFIPPQFAGKYKDGDKVVGKARKKEDKKKNKLSWCMISAL